MLKKKSKLQLFGIITCGILFCASYVGINWYSVPKKASATSNETRKITDIKYLQEMNKYICDNSAIGNNNTVLDVRDNNAYTIAKLKDSKCWMTQNLRITRESIKSKDSDNTTGKVTGGTSGNTNLDSGYYEIPASITSGFSDTTKTNNGETYYTNQEVRAAENLDYGAYYSYNVATLNKVWNQSGGTATYDICPKGWRLPTGGSGGEFQDLAKLYPAGDQNNGQPNATGWTVSGINNIAGRWLGAANTIADPSKVTNGGAFFPAAGYVTSSKLVFVGSEGYYWSNTIDNTTRAFRLGFANSTIGPADSYNRFAGFSVRCVANEKVLESENLSGPKTSETGSIAVKVANTLSIDAVSGIEEEVDSTSVANGTITATIAGNSNYKVLLSAEKTNLTSANSTNDAEIPASTNVAAGTNAWGIRNSDNSTYSAISNQEKEYYNTTMPSTNPAIPGTVHTFGIGISVSPSLPADTYSTEVTITAAAA